MHEACELGTVAAVKEAMLPILRELRRTADTPSGVYGHIPKLLGVTEHALYRMQLLHPAPAGLHALEASGAGSGSGQESEGGAAPAADTPVHVDFSGVMQDQDQEDPDSSGN